MFLELSWISFAVVKWAKLVSSPLSDNPTVVLSYSVKNCTHVFFEHYLLECSWNFLGLFSQYVRVKRVKLRLLSAFRYPTAVLLRELFERVWDYWQETHHGKEEEDCAKFFLERGLSLTSGVEGEFAIDGVQTCHMFLLRASSPAEVAELILHHKVR